MIAKKLHKTHNKLISYDKVLTFTTYALKNKTVIEQNDFTNLENKIQEAIKNAIRGPKRSSTSMAMNTKPNLTVDDEIEKITSNTRTPLQ